MKKWMQLCRIIFKDEAGQILPWITIGVVAMIGVTGLSLDFGQAYIVQRQLQTAANSAALAGAQILPADPTAQATAYSGKASTDNNYSSIAGAATTVVTGKCLTTLTGKGIPCMGPSGFNAVQVQQSVNVPTMFLRALNILPGVNMSSIPVSATATAGRSAPFPVNVAVIVDMTGSLDVPEQNDATCDSSHQEFQCQLYAVQSMLKGLQPCANGVTGSNCTPDKAFVRVALFTFPNVSSTAGDPTLTNEVTCGAGGPSFPVQHNGTNSSSNPYALTNITPEPYTFPSPTATDYETSGLTYSYTPPSGSTITPPSISATYEVVGFSSDYWDSAQTNGLNASSNLVMAVGQGNGSTQGCLNFPSGVVNTNIGNTYLAGSIYAAQAALVHEHSLYPNSMDYIIFISDGQSNVSSSGGTNQMAAITSGSIRNTTNDSGSPLHQSPPGVWPVFGSVSSSSGGLTALTGNGTYPDSNDQCQQAIMAAYAASHAATPSTVVAVANGAPGSGGCSDGSVVAAGNLNISITSGNRTSACTTMKDIATSLEDFYSTTSQGCVDQYANTDHAGASTLSTIFQNLTFGLVRAILIPNSTT